jgi:cell division septation protein DedD
VSPDRDDPIEDQELYEDIPPRSIFAATWFRVVLVLIVLGVIGAVAVPYVLDWMNPPPVSRSASVKATSPVPPATPISPLPASESAVSSSAEKKDAGPIPTPAPPPSLKSETKSSSSAPNDTKSSMAVTESTPKPAAKSESAAKTDSTPKPSAPAKTESAKSESAPKSSVAAKTEPPAKAEPPAKDDTKSATSTTPPAAKRAAAKATPPANGAAKAGGLFWVQVGAFKDAETAKRVATALRDQNYKVEESDTQVGAKSASGAAASSSAPSPAASPGDLYDVYVSGMSAVELTKRLSAKGLAAEASGGSVVVKPSLPLRDAVTLSKDLAVDGLKVQVRRAGSGAVASAPASPPPAAAAGETLHRVRVGAFTDVASARAAFKELESKGYKPFIARGDQ